APRPGRPGGRDRGSAAPTSTPSPRTTSRRRRPAAPPRPGPRTAGRGRSPPSPVPASSPRRASPAARAGTARPSGRRRARLRVLGFPPPVVVREVQQPHLLVLGGRVERRPVLHAAHAGDRVED